MSDDPAKEPTDWEAVRAKLRNQPMDPGLTPQQNEIAIEGTIREAQAAEEGRPFYFADVEQELEDLYRQVGAAPAGIEKAKAKVYASAQRVVAETGCSLEQSLFYAYHESLAIHREHLARAPAAPASQRRSESGGFFLFDDPTDSDFFGFD